LALQEQLNKAAANTNPEAEDLDAAIKAVQEATAAVAEASKPVAALVAKIDGINTQIAEKQKLVDAKTRQIADATEAMKSQQEAVVKATAAVKAAEVALKAQDAAKKAAEAEAKKAEAAAKPKNLNARSVAVPVQLVVHTTPGRLAAAVPGGGAIKKGTSIDVKVTLTRKNNFAGAVKVALVLPEGITSITSNSVDIPADQTEATLKLTAAADAAAADIANAVIRATTEFGGRMAQFDVPVALKVTE
jgi:ABC-type transporter Mla subunit MlaD